MSNKNELPRLKPCPCCGGEAKLGWNGQYEADVEEFTLRGISCTKCRLSLQEYTSRSIDVVAMWNRRAKPKQRKKRRKDVTLDTFLYHALEMRARSEKVSVSSALDQIVDEQLTSAGTIKVFNSWAKGEEATNGPN